MPATFPLMGDGFPSALDARPSSTESAYTSVDPFWRCISAKRSTCDDNCVLTS
jgi:hypothetical protein